MIVHYYQLLLSLLVIAKVSDGSSRAAFNGGDSYWQIENAEVQYDGKLINRASSLLLCCCYGLYTRYWEVIDRFITTPGFQNNDAQVA